uniref:Candidate secreted effector n=1 Tax=Meloidogyne incognita TaxID=6306 RepID=A0A914KV84_MELIC
MLVKLTAFFSSTNLATWTSNSLRLPSSFARLSSNSLILTCRLSNSSCSLPILRSGRTFPYNLNQSQLRSVHLTNQDRMLRCKISKPARC